VPAVKGQVIYGLIVGAAIFVPLERLFLLHKEQRILRRGWFTDVIHFLLTRTLGDICAFVVVGALLVLTHFLISPAFQAAIATQARSRQFFEAVMIANLGGYIGHRLSHEIPFLWRFHSVHHSIAEMDWLAAARVHPLDQIITKALTIIPLYVMGFSKATFGAYLGFATFHAVLIHANVRFRFGPFRWLITSPEYHHWHHSAERAAYNKNYAGELPLLDLIFGTFYSPKGERPQRYGTDEPVPSGYFAQLAYPFRGPKSNVQSPTSV
jgi:sterol desaturase/sphingolipid hydroxylase (fatty acid hydroxylase superfamily)